MSTPDEGPQGPDPVTPPPAGPYGQSPYGQPYGGPPQPYGYGYPPPYQAYGPQPSQKALWSMILGIGSIVGATVLYCFVVLGIGLGIPAIVLGVLARKEVNASGGRLTGGGQATAGLVTGIVGVILNVLVLALVIVLIASGEIDLSDY